MESEIFAKIKELLVTNLQVDEKQITPEAELVADLGVNSLELADLVLLCEETFDIEVDDRVIGNFITVKDVVEYLESVVKA